MLSHGILRTATRGPVTERYMKYSGCEFVSITICCPQSYYQSSHFQIKCDQYWPNESSEKFGSISVVTLDTVELAHYTVRTFRLYKVNVVNFK